ncbi:unnamed protein product, partial [Cuscuta epithymum]
MPPDIATCEFTSISRALWIMDFGYGPTLLFLLLWLILMLIGPGVRIALAPQLVTRFSWAIISYTDLGIHITSPVYLYCDHVSASYLGVNPIHHDRCKHIQIDCHFVLESAAHGDLIVRYMPTQFSACRYFYQKNLIVQRFHYLKYNLHVISS